MRKLLIVLAGLMAAAAFSAAAALAVPNPAPPAGWPAYAGSLDGAASGGCGSPLVLSSADVEYPAYGSFSAYNFDLSGTYSFATLPLGALVNDQFTVLSGSQSEGEPYMIVRFTDSTQVFVYSVEINGTGTGTYYSTLAGNQYITYSQALASYGSKTVKSVTLAVDNGGLSASFSGLHSDACPMPVAPPSGVFLCNGNPGGNPIAWYGYGLQVQLMTVGDGTGSGPYWSPHASSGHQNGGVNLFDQNGNEFHLVCSPPGSPGNGMWLTDGWATSEAGVAGLPGWYSESK